MKELWVKFKEWWGNLGERERKIIAWSASLLTIVIIYLWIWSPLIDSINNKRNRIKSDEKLLAWMEVADKEIQEMEKESQNKNTALSPVALLSFVQNKVKQAELDSHLSQLRQVTNETITMHFQKVDFDRLMRLLTTIAREEHVSVTQLSVISDKSPGMVTSDVMIKLG